MRTYDFTPLWRSTIGFDHLADLVDASLRQATDDNPPPLRCTKTCTTEGETRSNIEIVVCSKSDSAPRAAGSDADRTSGRHCDCNSQTAPRSAMTMRMPRTG